MQTDLLTEPHNSERTLVNARVTAFSERAVFEAFANPAQLKEWWGPNGFTNTFHEFQFVPGGDWRFTMHAPDGAKYENFCRFVAIDPNEMVVVDHIEPVHNFRLVAKITKTGIGTEIQFCMTFALAEEYERVKDFVRIANEQNLDRLEAVLQKTKTAKEEDT
jgi:uncharacterized protein YndB with AHSA1/START domain